MQPPAKCTKSVTWSPPSEFSSQVQVRRNHGVEQQAARTYSGARRDISKRDGRLLVAAHEAGDFPAAGLLAVTELVVAERGQCLGRHEARLARGRHHL